jgi:hypothetical protein
MNDNDKQMKYLEKTHKEASVKLKKTLLEIVESDIESVDCGNISEAKIGMIRVQGIVLSLATEICQFNSALIKSGNAAIAISFACECKSLIDQHLDDDLEKEKQKNNGRVD